jgi:MFS transporter, MHS family, shikimate and dehydroshikimate transport protein
VTEKMTIEPTPSTRSLRRVVLGSFIGTAIEWYDFFIYGLAAALVLGPQFFPTSNPSAGTLSAFATFAVGFLARPVGSIVFSHFGDRVGRKAALVASLLMMGGATFLVGLLPGYATLGILAPILLVVLRFIQGLAVGGEWGGAVLMAVEHAGTRRRGLSGSWPQMGVPCGLVLASLAFTAVSAMPAEQFNSYGWRIPFLASGLLVVVGLMIRLKLEESPVFQQTLQAGKTVRFPVVEAVRRDWRRILLTAGMRQETTLFYISVTFVVSYATEHVGVSRTAVLNAGLVASILALLTIPIFGALSDRFGRKPVFLSGAALGLGSMFIFFQLVDTGSPFLIGVAITMTLSVAWAGMYAPEAAWFSELFATDVRYSGASLGYQLGSVIGGLAPLAAAALLLSFDGGTTGIVLYVAGLLGIVLVSALMTPETRLQRLDDEPSGPLGDSSHPPGAPPTIAAT